MSNADNNIDLPIKCLFTFDSEFIVFSVIYGLVLQLLVIKADTIVLWVFSSYCGSIRHRLYVAMFPSDWRLLLLIMYFPFGLLFLLLRIFIGFHAFVISCILPKPSFIRNFVLRILCSVLGFVVTQSQQQRHNSTKESLYPRVVVANHLHPFDHTAIDLVQPCVLPSVWDLPLLLRWCLGYKDLGAKAGRDTLIANAKKFCKESSVPLLAFPEGALTNGNVGMLRFSSWPFSLDVPIQPVLISIRRPTIAYVSPTTLGSRWWVDLLWCLFVPYTHFCLRWLPVMEKLANESADEFASRVQRVMCAVANLKPTAFSSHDVVEFAKRLLVERTDKYGDPALDAMCEKVKDVVPHVPMDVIRSNLLQTRNVQATLANIFENRLKFTPVLLSQNTLERKARRKSPGKIDIRKTFERNRDIVISNNRRKYLIRKGLVPACFER